MSRSVSLIATRFLRSSLATAFAKPFSPEEMKEASKLALSLHYLALGKLTSIGQTWPSHLKGVLGQNELLRGRLELAVKADQERSKSSQKTTTTYNNYTT